MIERWTASAGVWRSWTGLVAIALIAAQFAGRGYYLWGGYFVQDDFNMLRLGGENSLTWSFLMQEYSGHVWPGNFLVAWANAQIDATSWGLAATFLLLVQAGAGAMMWLVLCRISDDWRIRLPLLVVYLACPLTLWPTQWWASGIGFVPLSFFMLVAVWAMLRHLQEQWRPGPFVMAAACLAGLTFQERALLYALVLGGLAVVMGEGGPLTRVLRALRTYWPVWVSVVVVVAGWMAVRSSITTVEVSAGGADVNFFVLVRDYFFRSLFPGLAGGPWAGAERVGGGLVPRRIASVVGSSVTIAALLVLVWRTRMTGRLAVVMVLLYAVADLILIFGGRIQFDGAFGLVPRYMSDVTPVACVFLAIALTDLRPRRAARRSAANIRFPVSPTHVVIAATVAYVASATWTTTVIAPMEQSRESRDYVQTLRASVAQNPEAVIYDRPVPEDVMTWLFEDDGRVSTVLSGAPEQPVFDVFSDELLVPDSTGRLEEVELSLVRDLGPDAELGDCGFRVDRRGDPVSIELDDEGPVRAWYVLRLDYFVGSDTLVTVRLDGRAKSFLALEGAGQVSLVIDEDTEEIELDSLRDHGVVCVTHAEVGFPTQVL